MRVFDKTRFLFFAKCRFGSIFIYIIALPNIDVNDIFCKF